MRRFRASAFRRVILVAWAFAFLLALGEEGFADVHDGGATAEEIVRLTGAPLDATGGPIGFLPAPPSQAPETPDRPLQACHCVHAHAGVIAAGDGAMPVSGEHRDLQVPGADRPPAEVSLEPSTPPPIA